MRFRCPSVSSESELSDQPSVMGTRLSRRDGNGTKTPGPSNPKMSSKNEQVTKRRRSSVSSAKLKEIEMARKKATLRRHLRKREWSYVFVGNIHPTVNESDLHRIFAPCGTITRVQIRCSRGGAVTVGNHGRISADQNYQYATIEFLNANAVKKALKFNGSKLRGAQLVVSVSAADLPEVQDIVHKHLSTICEQKSLASPQVVKPKGSKPLRIYQTELLIDVTRQVEPDRNLILGFSFCKSLI